MNELRELIGIVTKSKLRAVASVTGKSFAPGPQALKLYDLIADGTVMTDEQAIEAIYPPSKIKTAAQPFSRLKNSLFEYLTQMLLVIDLNLPQYNQRQKAYFESYKEWAAVKILVGKNAHRSSLMLATELLKTAKKFDFTDISLDVARSLRLYYGSIEGDLKKHKQYSDEVGTLEEMFHYENLSEYFYTDLVINFVNDKSAKKKVHDEALKLFKQVEKGLEKHQSYRLHFMGRLLEILIYTSVNDYKNTVKVCDKAIRFFENKPYTASVPLQAFLYQEMVCYVQLRDYERGAEAARRGISLLIEGSYNWFKYQELQLLLAFHTEEYGVAYQIYRVTVRHRRFGGLPGSLQQIWKIFEAYLFYLYEVGKIPAGIVDKAVFSRFRMTRFVNDTPIHSRDKRGMNIPILIFQILYLILTKRYDDSIDRIERIERYTSRYLKKDDNFRSNCFIKMLLQIPDSSFHKAAVIRNAEKFHKMLKSMPLDFANQSHDIELIPYEKLWGFALDSLNNEFVKTKRKADHEQ